MPKRASVFRPSFRKRSTAGALLGTGASVSTGVKTRANAASLKIRDSDTDEAGDTSSEDTLSRESDGIGGGSSDDDLDSDDSSSDAKKSDDDLDSDDSSSDASEADSQSGSGLILESGLEDKVRRWDRGSKSASTLGEWSRAHKSLKKWFASRCIRISFPLSAHLPAHRWSHLLSQSTLYLAIPKISSK